MAQGTLRCIGSAAELKSKYRPGYNIEIIFTENRLVAATQLVEALLPMGWTVVQNLHHFRVYTFVPNGADLGSIFDAMSRDARKSGILTWGITQTTLDEVFSAILDEDDM